MAELPILSLRRYGPGSTSRIWLLSELLAASTRAASLVAFVSGADSSEVEEEGRTGSASDSAPKAIMSMATLFFFIFLPSCEDVVRGKRTIRIVGTEEQGVYLDEVGG